MRTPRTGLILSTLCLTLLALPAGARADDDLEWEYHRLMSLDYVGASVMGMPYHGSWSLREKSSDASSATRIDNADAGTMFGAGWGIQLNADVPHGMRLQFSALYHSGPLVDTHLPFTVVSNADHGELGAGFGWQHQWGRLSFHTTTIIALDSTSFDGENLTTGNAISQGLNSSVIPGGRFTVSRFDVTAGQQVGIHIALTRWLLAYLDGQIDITGEWHVRCGLGIGGFGGSIHDGGGRNLSRFGPFATPF